MFKGAHQPDPIDRPQSVVSVADTITTTTSIADFEDSLSTVTTPRGGSPIRFGVNNIDLPPSYDESQAAHITEGPTSPQHLPHEAPPGVLAHSVQQVYRTEIPHRSFSDDPHSHLHSSSAHELAFHAPPFAHPGSSALLYQALSFTNAPAPSTQTAEYVQHLTRPVAIPSLPPGVTNPPTIAGVRFARFNARALTGAAITPAQHAAFIDGLNAVSTASGFDAAQLRDASTPSLLNTATMGAGMPREEWVRAYVQLCNERFFQPRGLRVAITTLQELAVLAKVPELRGFREGILSDVLEAAGEAAQNEEDGEDALIKAASNAATKLGPYIEPLGMMIPAMSRDNEAMDHVARGLATFSLDEKPLPPHPNLRRSATDQPRQSPRAIDRFWNPMGMGPISVGPIVPPRLPRSQLTREASWQMWAEDLGKRFETWGEEYGKQWDTWGREYGKAWEEWSIDFQRKHAGHGSSTVSAIPGAGASMESFNTVSSRSSKKGKARQVSNAGQGELEDDDDDSSSISSDSTSSSDDWSDPEANFVKRLADIEEIAEKARIEGKRSPAKIDKERGSALRKAEEKRTKEESHLERKIKKREVKRHARKFKKDVKKWKKDFKKDTKQLSKKKCSPDEMRALIAEKRTQFEKMRGEWEARRVEASHHKQERGMSWREAREHRRQNRHHHHLGRHGRHDRGRGRRGEDCPIRGSGDTQIRDQPEQQTKPEGFLTEDNMLWVVIMNLE